MANLTKMVNLANNFMVNLANVVNSLATSRLMQMPRQMKKHSNCEFQQQKLILFVLLIFLASSLHACKRGPSCLVICIALLLADEFGEFANLATFVKFAIFAACEKSPLVLLCELPCCMLTN